MILNTRQNYSNNGTLQTKFNSCTNFIQSLNLPSFYASPTDKKMSHSKLNTEKFVLLKNYDENL